MFFSFSQPSLPYIVNPPQETLAKPPSPTPVYQYIKILCYRELAIASQARREVGGGAGGNAGFSWLGDLAALIRFYSLVAGGSPLGAGGRLKRELAWNLIWELIFLLALQLI